MLDTAPMRSATAGATGGDTGIPALDRHPRFPLAFLPTPLHPLDRLSERLGGPRIWLKRDDSTGLAAGGNKVRKLEYLVADALAQGCDTLVTVGPVQSNHTRQTAAAAARAGLQCELVTKYWNRWGGQEYRRVGNPLLSRILGARPNLIEASGGRIRLDEEPEFLAVVDRLRAEGRKLYLIPAGASDHPLGGLGYARAASEIVAQAEAVGVRFKAVVHATSSGSTQAGLVAGLHALGVALPVVGIEVNGGADRTRAMVSRILLSTAERLGMSPPDAVVELVEGHAGEGYALPTEQARDAILLAARTEGVLLDPVYEGKGLAGLLALIAAGRFGPGDDVLFLHLGGTPALHAYAPLFEAS